MYTSGLSHTVIFWQCTQIVDLESRVLECLCLPEVLAAYRYCLSSKALVTQCLLVCLFISALEVFRSASCLYYMIVQVVPVKYLI